MSKLRLFTSQAALLIIASSATASVGARCDRRPEPKRPNIVLLYGDDHAQSAVGSYGSILCKTPRIDRLASEGMRFTESFVTNSICGPARAVVLTGLHSHLNGKRTNGAGFLDDLPTFAKTLQASGYQTAMVGKWHIQSPPNGFDHWRVLQGSYYSPTWKTPEGNTKASGYCTDLITDETLRWLREERDPEKPFMIWVSHKAAHRSWEPATRHLGLYEGQRVPEPSSLFDDHDGRSAGASAAQMTIARDLFPAYDLKLPITGEGILDDRAQGHLNGMSPEQLEAWEQAYGPRNEALAQAQLTGDELVRWKYQRYIKDYLRCLAALDEGVGRVVDALDELGLAEDTIVIYTSDQGFFLGEHGWYDKRWMYEPSMRTPLIVRWPGVTQAGSTSDALVQNLDLAPTLLEMGGEQAQPQMQGMSLVPLLTQESESLPREALYYHYHQRDSGRLSHMVEPHYGVRTSRYKLMYVYGLETFELYDLQADPGEMNNLWGDESKSVLQAKMLAMLSQVRKDYGDETGKPF